MLTLTSAKRFIRLLICLNIVTILASVMVISSGMFVANANPFGSGKRCPTTLTSSFAKPIFNVKNFATSYTGSMLTTKGQVIGKITSMAFRGTPPKSSTDQGSLTHIKLDITGSGVSQNLHSPDGLPLPPLPNLSFDQDVSTSFNGFTLTSGTITITFKSVHFTSSTAIVGNYSIADTNSDPKNNFNGYQGPWTVHS